MTKPYSGEVFAFRDCADRPMPMIITNTDSKILFMSYLILEFTAAKVLFLPYEVFHILDIPLALFRQSADEQLV